MTNETDGPRRPGFQLLNMNNTEVAQAAGRANVDPLQEQVGRHFAREHDDRFCFDHGLSQWMVWNGTIWEKDEDRQSLDTMLQFTNRLRLLDPGPRKALATVGFNHACLEVASVDRAMARRHAAFNNAPYILATPDGYVDLRTGVVTPPDRSKLVTFRTSVGPQPGDCPQWLKFLNEAHRGQEEIVDWLQKLCGEALLGLQTSHHFVFFYGTGGNGKTQFLEAVKHIMGGYSSQAQEKTFTQPEGKAFGGQHAQVLARLEGARLVVVSEPGEGEQWDMGRVKHWSGGGEITADMKFKDAQTFTPTGLLVLESNKKLKVDKVNNAVARRLRLVNWPHKFAGEGYDHLKIEDIWKRMVEAEGPQILAWMIKGAQRVLAEGLGSTPIITQASTAYLREQDIMGRFVEDCFEEDEHVQPGINLRDAVTVYNEWALRNEAPARKNLGSSLIECGLVVTKSNTDRYVRQRSLTEEGRALMSSVLSRRIKDKELTKAEARRWEPMLREWKLHGDEGEFLAGLLGEES